MGRVSGLGSFRKNEGVFRRPVVTAIVIVFPELEAVLGLKLHNSLNVENESSEKKVRDIL